MYLKFGQKAQRVFQAFHRGDREYLKPEVIVLYGPAGVGKTARAIKMCKERKLEYWKKATTMGMWFDGYDGEPAVIFDEFRGSQWKLSQFLEMLDGYGLLVQQKVCQRAVDPSL